MESKASAATGDQVWLKRVLVPLWVVQIAACIALVGVSAFALWAAGQAAADGAFNGDSVSQWVVDLNIGAALSLALALITILLDAYEIILVLKQTLKPVANVVVQCIKSIIWTIWFCLTIIAATRDEESGLGIFLALALFATSIGQLVYGSIILHRYKKGTQKGRYSLAETGQLRPHPYTVPYEQPNWTAYKPPVDDIDELALPQPHRANATNYYGTGGTYGHNY